MLSRLRLRSLVQLTRLIEVKRANLFLVCAEFVSYRKIRVPTHSENTGFSPKEYERRWQQILRDGIENGEFRPDLDIQVASYGLLGMLNWLYKWYDPQGRLSVQEVAEQFTTLALAGLAANKPHAISPAKPKRTRLKPAP